MEEKEFDFSLDFRGRTPIVVEEYTGYYIKLLVYKDEYYEGTGYSWDFYTDEKFCDEYGNELDDSELPPGFNEAFEEFIRTDSRIGNFDTIYDNELNSWNYDN